MVVATPPSVELRAFTEDDWTAAAEIYWDGMRDGLATFAVAFQFSKKGVIRCAQSIASAPNR